MFRLILAGHAACIGLLSLFWMGSAAGGVISFDIRAANRIVSVTHTGDSVAFDPSVFALDASGEWRPLETAGKTAFQWNPQEQLSFVLPPPDRLGYAQPLASLRALMVCFFDQAGVEFGQLAFLNPPPHADDVVVAGYRGGKLYIQPPAKDRHIAATWVLWTNGEGIGSIAAPLKLQHVPPRPRTIRWADVGPVTQTIDTGRALPAAYLVHQVVTDHGSNLVLQVVAEGGMTGSEQRAPWLSQGPMFYRIGGAFFAAGAVGVLAATASARRKKRPDVGH